jgi:hypothetical protein
MNKLTSITKRRKELQEIFEKGAQLEAHIDDVGLSTDTPEDHFAVLKAFFEVCKENSLRIRLDKCEFLAEELEYLGFTIGWNWWKPTQAKVEALSKATVKNQKNSEALLEL